MRHNLRDDRGRFATETRAVRRVRAVEEARFALPVKPTFADHYEARRMKFRLPKKLKRSGWRIGKLVMSPSQSNVEVTVYRPMEELPPLEDRYTLSYMGRAE